MMKLMLSLSISGLWILGLILLVHHDPEVRARAVLAWAYLAATLLVVGGGHAAWSIGRDWFARRRADRREQAEAKAEARAHMDAGPSGAP